MDSSDTLPAIVIPGPELREKVDKFASRISQLEKRKADEMVAKVLASPKRNQFLFVDTSHIFYPYFLSKVSEYRQNPDSRPDAKKEGGAAAAAASTAAAPSGNNATTTSRAADGIVRTVGGTLAAASSDPKREELLRQAESEAKRYLEDPFPAHYGLDLKGGTVDVPALVMDILSCTAQYTAKYGDAFLAAVQSKRKRDPAFRFLEEDDIRHDVFLKLVASYKRILNFDADETENRLESLQQCDYVLNTVCMEKTKYMQSNLARRKAALLTDDELKAKLQWHTFKVVKSFSLSDLLLDGVVPDTAASRRQQQVHAAAAAAGRSSAMDNEDDEGEQDPTAAVGRATSSPQKSHTLLPPGGMPSFSPVFMSSNLVQGATTTSASASSSSAATRGARSSAAVVVDENYAPQAIAPVRRGVDYFVDAETGERLKAAEVAAGPSGGSGGPAPLKRSREDYGLSSEDDMLRELKRQELDRSA